MRIKNLELSGRNIPKVKVLRTEGLNVYDVIRNDWLVLTKRAAQAVESRLAPTVNGVRGRRMRSIYEVIRRPIISEKSTLWRKLAIVMLLKSP